MPQHVFISYARGDQQYVDRLARYVTDAGFDVWYDRSIDSGSSFSDRIQAAIDSSVALIAVLTPESMASKWVLREISYADQRNLPIIPLLLRDCEKPIELARLQHHDARDGRLVGPEFIEVIAQHALRRPVPPGAGPRHSTAPPGRRRRAWLVAAVALAVVLVGGGVAAYLATRPAQPSVTVAMGTPCGDGIGAVEECPGGFCTWEACAYIHVTTANFAGPVACSFASEGHTETWVQNVPWGPDEAKDSPNWLGIAGTEVVVTCGGVEGRTFWPVVG